MGFCPDRIPIRSKEASIPYPPACMGPRTECVDGTGRDGWTDQARACDTVTAQGKIWGRREVVVGEWVLNTHGKDVV